MSRDAEACAHLAPAISPLNVHEEYGGVMLEKPRSEVSALALIVAPTLVELFVHRAEQVVEVSRHSLPGHELLELLGELITHVLSLHRGSGWEHVRDGR